MILFLEWEGHSVLASSCFRVKYAAFSFQTPHTRMLSRLAGPVLRGPGALLSSNIYCIAPATFTTLHGSTSATVKPNKQRQARFSPTTGVTIGDYQPVSDTKLFHVTRPTPNLKSDWEQVKKMYLHDTGILYKLKGYSPRALTAKAPKEVQPYLQLMRFDRPTGGCSKQWTFVSVSCLFKTTTNEFFFNVNAHTLKRAVSIVFCAHV